MKKKVGAILLSLTSVFAQDAFPTKFDVTLHEADEKLPKHSYTYVRTDVAPIPGVGTVPGLGIGYRLSSGGSAVDFSTGFASGIVENTEGTFWTFPKVNYLHYLTPDAENSLYVGGGLAVGGIVTDAAENDHANRFYGTIANATVGYELKRSERFRSFIQLDVNQPTITAEKQGAFPGPWAALSIGAGY